MGEQENRGYIAEQSKQLWNAFLGSELYDSLDFSQKAQIALIPNSVAIDAISNRIIYGQKNLDGITRSALGDDLYKNLDKKFLDGHLRHIIAANIFQVGNIKRDSKDEGDFYQKLRVEYGEVPDALKPLVDKIIEVDNERANLVKCVRDIPDIPQNEIDKETPLYKKMLVDNLFTKLGAEVGVNQPEFLTSEVDTPKHVKQCLPNIKTTNIAKMSK